MRVFALILCLFAPLRFFAAESGPLLVLTEPTARGYLGTLLDKWRNGVLHESNWTQVVIIELPRWTGTYATNDWPGLLRMSNAVAFYKPSAVQIIGRLPPYMSGGHSADGHELRRTVNDNWLGCTNLTVTDTINWGMPGTVAGLPSLLGTNVPGDGIPDETDGVFSIPVCRLDASGLTAAGGNFAAGYLASQPYQPAIDEAYWLRCYMTNNLSFRAKQWAVAETGVIVSDCCWFNASTITATNKAVTWAPGINNTDLGGGVWRWTYDSVQLSDVSPYMITAGGVPLRTFYSVNYKSYGMEIASGTSPITRRLFPGYINQPLALVSGWCRGALGIDAYWIGTVADVTVADSIRSSVNRYAAGGTKLYLFYAWLLGDLTLPIDAIVQDPPFVTRFGDLPVGTVAP